MTGAAPQAADINAEPYVELAEAVADAVRPIVMGHFRKGGAVEAKADESPVTAADREAETAMRTLIRASFPEHGIFGEEQESERPEAEYVWVLDPIDGTQSFVTGKPLFGTLIALTRHGAPLVGVMDMPALKERWVGAPGRKTLFNGVPAATRPCAGLRDAWLYATSPQMFPGQDFAAFERLRKQSWRAIYGAECYAYGLLAGGFVDLVAESGMQPYDFCALVPLVEGAGGMITDWEGRRLTIESGPRVLAAGDSAVHAAAVRVLAGAADE